MEFVYIMQNVLKRRDVMKEIKVGLIGLGTVGVGVVKTLSQNADVISERSGLDIKITKIADLDIKTDRGVSLDNYTLTTDANDILNDNETDIVVELVGGTTIAKTFVIAALENKKHVVTANKALLSTFGRELFEIADKNGVNLMYEASVAGGIPIIKAVKESLRANKINEISGIINGTANYILSNMAEKKVEFQEALDEASAKGYAEADPSYDVDGIDTAHKLVILASLCFDTWVDYDQLLVEGISQITAEDISYADKLGYVIKLLAIAKEENGVVEARVHPTFVPKDKMIAKVDGTFNAVLVDGNAVDETLFYGRGAGEMPTASAVAGDIVDVAVKMTNGSSVQNAFTGTVKKPVKDIMDIETKAYLRLHVTDKPGVLAKISAIFAENNISISSVMQPEMQDGKDVPLILMVHKSKASDIEKALQEIKKTDTVVGDMILIRVQGD